MNNTCNIQNWYNNELYWMRRFMRIWNGQQDKELYPKLLEKGEWDEQFHFFIENNKITPTSNLESVGIYTIEDVLDHAINPNTSKRLPDYKTLIRRDYNGYSVKMNSMRYWVFKHKGIKCVKCGIEGKFFSLDKIIQDGVDTYHFNLFAGDSLASRDQWTLITKDHIKPKSRGGGNGIDNMQTMCSYCNCEKGSEYHGRF